MIRDAFLLLADTITVGSSTAAVISTNHIDTLAASDDYAGCFFVSDAVTAVLSGTGGATVTYNLLTGSTTVASACSVLVSSGAIDDATVIAGYRVALRIPSGGKRYLMGSTVTTQVTTSGTVSQYICKDVDMNSTMVA